MGYYSDAILVLNGQASKKLKTALKTASDSEASLFIFPDKHYYEPSTGLSLIQKEPNGVEIFVWHNTKFYDDFDEVKFLRSFLDGLKPVEYTFQRIGEELGDYEDLGSFTHTTTEGMPYSFWPSAHFEWSNKKLPDKFEKGNSKLKHRRGD